MSYDALIKKNVRLVFKLIKDIGVDATFSTKTSEIFNFSTGEASHKTTNKIAKVIIVDTKSKDRDIKRKEVYVNTEDMPNFRLMDTVTISGIAWTVGELIEHNNYLTQFNVFRE